MDIALLVELGLVASFTCCVLWLKLFRYNILFFGIKALCFIKIFGWVKYICSEMGRLLTLNFFFGWATALLDPSLGGLFSSFS